MNSLTIKPKFNVLYYSLPSLLLFIIIIIFSLVIFIVDDAVLKASVWWVILKIFAFIFFIMMPYKMYKYEFITFLIAEDKLSYIRDFLGYYRNDIKYENIKEVIISQGMIQKLFRLGDVHLISNIAAGNAGITFFNLENPHQVYELIQEKITQHQNR